MWLVGRIRSIICASGHEGVEGLMAVGGLTTAGRQHLPF